MLNIFRVSGGLTHLDEEIMEFNNSLADCVKELVAFGSLCRTALVKLSHFVILDKALRDKFGTRQFSDTLR